MTVRDNIAPLRVFMITESLCKGGKERRILELLRFLNTHYPVKVMLVLLGDKVEYEEVNELKNVTIHILRRRIKKDPGIYGQIYRLCKEFRPGLIHSWGSMPSVYAFPVARILKIPFLNGMITNAICKPFSSSWMRSRLTFPFSDKILGNSHAGLKAFKVKKGKGVVIHNGFNPDRLKKAGNPSDLRKEYRIKTRYLIAMIGAFHRRKDYAVYLATAQSLIELRKDITFMAIGDGEELAEYKKKYQACDRIVFTGNVMNIEWHINALDIGVLLTDPAIHHEGISNALMEMMAFSKPVIASPGGGNRELIENGSSGILISVNSVEELRKHIITLLDDEDLRNRIGSDASRRIEESFSIRSMSENMYKLYQQLNRNMR